MCKHESKCQYTKNNTQINNILIKVTHRDFIYSIAYEEKHLFLRKLLSEKKHCSVAHKRKSYVDSQKNFRPS